MMYSYFFCCFLQVLDPIDEFIPEDMHDFISARALFDEVVDLVVGEPIDKSEYCVVCILVKFLRGLGVG